MKNLLVTWFWLLVSTLSQSVLGASIWALAFDPTSLFPTNLYPHDAEFGYSGVVGWTFVLTQPVTVTGLGWFEQNPAGLITDHQIGIWQYRAGVIVSTNRIPYTNAPLVVSAVVPAGTNAPLNQGFREVDLATPTTLPMGFYVIAGTYYSPTPEGPDSIKGVLMWDVPQFTGDPRVQIGNPAIFYDYEDYGTNNVQNPQLRIPNDFAATDWGDEVSVGPNIRLVPLPSLQVAREGSEFVLSWPAEATNFVLESTSALGPGASWATVTNAVTLSDGSWVSTNAIGAGSAFYRLRGP